MRRSLLKFGDLSLGYKLVLLMQVPVRKFDFYCLGVIPITAAVQYIKKTGIPKL